MKEYVTKSKYRNKKIYIEDVKFDSIKEAKRYQQLKILEKKNEIKELKLQKTFELQPSFKLNNKTIRSIKYICDFFYFDTKTKEYVVEDVKGYRTTDYKLKKKMFEYKYKIEIKEI